VGIVGVVLAKNQGLPSIARERIRSTRSLTRPAPGPEVELARATTAWRMSDGALQVSRVWLVNLLRPLARTQRLAASVVAIALALSSVAHAQGGVYFPQTPFVMLGVAIGPTGPLLSYGLQFMDAPSHWFLRVEGRGISYLRIAAGITASTGNPWTFNHYDGTFFVNRDERHVGAEIGVVGYVGGPHAIKSSLGVHGGVGGGNDFKGLLLEGSWPIFGDKRAWEGCVNMGLMPDLRFDFHTRLWHLNANKTLGAWPDDMERTC
jgi:hypothetical protein